MATKYGLPESFTSYHDTMRVELGEVIDSGHSALCNMLRYHMGWQSGIDCHLDFFGSMLGQLYSQKSIEGEDITKVTKILDQPGARDYAENLAEQYYY